MTSSTLLSGVLQVELQVSTKRYTDRQKIYIDGHNLNALRTVIVDNNSANNVKLTPREIDILRLVGTGKTNAQIGIALGISARTVRSLLENIMQKIKANNRAEAVIKAVVLGLVKFS